MNIAHCVESYAPAIGGMAEVVRQISERLVQMGHAVTVLTSNASERVSSDLNGVRIRSFNLQGNAVNGISGNAAEYLRALRDGQFDVVVFFAAQQWATDAALPYLSKFTFKKIFVPTGFSALFDVRYANYYKEMATWLGQMDMNVFLSETYRDFRFAKEQGIQKIVVIPNGAAEEEFEPTLRIDIRTRLDIPANHRIVLHVGSFIWTKGQIDAMDIFLQSSLKDATLLMIGNGAPDFGRQLLTRPLLCLQYEMSSMIGEKLVKFVSLTRAETLAAYHAADLFLFPSKIECSPIVLFEAMASKTPFLATDVGNAREIAERSQAGWVLPTNFSADRWSHADIHRSVDLLNRIMSDPQILTKAAEAGHRSWKQNFTWRKVALQYEELYRQVTCPFSS
jgi:glycosyltransferase involved in cell wall biosynthesis